jgi:hypothetical protein
MRTQEQEATGYRTTQGTVASDGSIAAGTGFTVSKSGTGQYTVRCRGYRAIIGATAALAAGSGVVVPTINSPASLASAGVPVNVYTLAGAAIDAAFSFTATGLAR